MAVAGAALGGGKLPTEAAVASEAANSNPALIQTVGESGEGINRYIEYMRRSVSLQTEYAEKAAELDLLETADIAAAAEKVLPDEFEILMTDLSFLNSQYDAHIRAGKPIPKAVFDGAAGILAKVETLLNGNRAAVDTEARKVRIKYEAGKEALAIELRYALSDLKAEYSF